MAGIGSSMMTRRIAKELQAVQKDPTTGVTAQTVVEDEGGLFFVDCKFPSEYPMKPPLMKFMSKTGAICLDVLKSEWSPAITLTKMLQSLQALLCAPEPTDPQDAVVAKQYMEDNEAWQAKAKKWTAEYAGPLEDKAGTLEAMGFAKDKGMAALMQSGGDLEQAAAALLATS